MFAYKKIGHSFKHDKFKTSDTIAVLWNGLSENNTVDFSFLFVLFPDKNKCALYFINPLSSFDDPSETLEKSKLPPQRYLSHHLEYLTSRPVFNYINLRRENLIKIVNMLGGTGYFFEPGHGFESKKFNYPLGEVSLYGEEILDLTALKESPAPIDYVDRMNRHKSFIMNLFQRMRFLNNKFYPAWMEYFYTTIDTNLSPADFQKILEYIANNQVEYGLEEPSGELATNDAGKTILKIKKDVSKNSYLMFEDALVNGDYFLLDSARIEILNGTEENGLARRIKSTLNNRRIKILSTENAWTTRIKYSVIIDRSGKTEYATKVAKVLGIKNVIHIIKKDSGLDTTVILGADFEVKY